MSYAYLQLLRQAPAFGLQQLSVIKTWPSQTSLIPNEDYKIDIFPLFQQKHHNSYNQIDVIVFRGLIWVLAKLYVNLWSSQCYC